MAFRVTDPKQQAALLLMLQEIKDLAEQGYEVHIGYHPCRYWPYEADEIPAQWRWRCFLTAVPGTDMCVSAGYGTDIEEAMSDALGVLKKGRKQKTFPKKYRS